MTPALLDGPLLRLAHPVFDLGEGLLDRVEIGRIGRQKPQPRTSSADHLPDGGGFVAPKIVPARTKVRRGYHNVTRLQHRHELLLNIGAETYAIDRPIEDARRRETVMTQGTEECQRAPVTMRGKSP